MQTSNKALNTVDLKQQKWDARLLQQLSLNLDNCSAIVQLSCKTHLMLQRMVNCADNAAACIGRLLQEQAS